MYENRNKTTRSTLTSDWPRACQRGVSEPIRGQCPLCPVDVTKVPLWTSTTWTTTQWPLKQVNTQNKSVFQKEQRSNTSFVFFLKVKRSYLLEPGPTFSGFDDWALRGRSHFLCLCFPGSNKRDTRQCQSSTGKNKYTHILKINTRFTSIMVVLLDFYYRAKLIFKMFYL